jgi:hypothetical protein
LRYSIRRVGRLCAFRWHNLLRAHPLDLAVARRTQLSKIGTVLVREWDRQVQRVMVMADGFAEWPDFAATIECYSGTVPDIRLCAPK